MQKYVNSASQLESMAALCRPMVNITRYCHREGMLPEISTSHLSALVPNSNCSILYASLVMMIVFLLEALFEIRQVTRRLLNSSILQT